MRDPLDPTYRIHPTCAWRRLDDHVFILNDRDAFVTLDDPVALVLWRRLEAGPCTGHDLLDAVLAAFEVPPGPARADLIDFLASLVEGRGLDAT